MNRIYVCAALAVAVLSAAASSAATLTLEFTATVSGTIYDRSESLGGNLISDNSTTVTNDVITGQLFFYTDPTFTTLDSPVVVRLPLPFGSDTVSAGRINTASASWEIKGSLSGPDDGGSYSLGYDLLLPNGLFSHDLTGNMFAASDGQRKVVADMIGAHYQTTGYSISGTLTALKVSPFPPSAAPEPASWILMIGGIGMAGGMLRRRRQMRNAVASA